MFKNTGNWTAEVIDVQEKNDRLFYLVVCRHPLVCYTQEYVIDSDGCIWFNKIVYPDECIFSLIDALDNFYSVYYIPDCIYDIDYLYSQPLVAAVVAINERNLGNAKNIK